MSVQVNALELPILLKETLEANLVAMIHGSPAIGKSDIVRQVADEFNLEVIDFRLSQSDPTDLNGFPSMNSNKTKSTFVPMDTFPIAGDPLPPGKNGWLLFLDEMNSAPLSVQAAAFKLVLDRMVGKFHIHPNVAIIAAGNLATDKAIVNRLSTPMQSRLVHFELIIDHKAWINWAIKNKIDHRIISFIGFKPEILYNFQPDHNGYTFASPRTWEFMNRLIKKYDKEIPARVMPLMAATIDEAAAREFFVYAQIFEELITIPQIMSDPLNCVVPTEPAIQYALSGSLGHNINKVNADTLMKYLSRMGIEFQVLCLQQALERDPDLSSLPAVNNWIIVNSKELF